MLAVIDYGGGNLGSLLAALTRRGTPFVVSGDANVIAAADAAIFPGDGAFGATMEALRVRGLDTAIHTLIARGRPFLGICVGMQVLFEKSTELGEHRGLGIFPGVVERLSDQAPRVPHMGWNTLEILRDHPVITDVAAEEYVYFLHSYRAPIGEYTVAAATHGDRFSAVVARDAIVATQFHPEKSQRTGGKILDGFLALCAAA